jgi:hypothetical protein
MYLFNKDLWLKNQEIHYYKVLNNMTFKMMISLFKDFSKIKIKV